MSSKNLLDEVAELIVTALNLEMSADQIEPDERLFGDGLGLDSIDALELSLEIEKRYGYQLRSDDPDIQEIFRTLRSLSSAIEKNRSK